MRECEGVLFNTEATLVAGRDLIETVKQRARTSPRHSGLACLHRDNAEPVLEILIGATPGGTRPPHVHAGRSETHLVLEGEMIALFFDDRGALVRRVDMGPPGGTKPFCLRIASGEWHMMVFRSPVVVCYEVMSGPHVKQNSLTWAPWAPAPDDEAGLSAYAERLLSE